MHEKSNKYITAEIIEKGYIDCFPEVTYNSNNTPASCELSGVAYYRDSLFFVNDKMIPATTPFMACRFKVPFFASNLRKMGSIKVINARKLEDIAVTPRLKYMFMITAFDRVSNKTAELDPFNTLLYKNLGGNDVEHIAYYTKRNGVESSLRLRKMIKNALKSKLYKTGPPYFKIAGLAAIPGNIMLFGIREIGSSVKNYQYTFMIVGGKYDIIDGEFMFTEGLDVLYYFNPEDFKQVREKVGLTALDYDIYNNRLFITAAYENNKTDEGIGGYIWVLPINDLKKRKSPKLAVNFDGIPLKFPHKPGGIAVLDERTVFVVHDDDRITGSDVVLDEQTQFHRKLNQAAYSIIDVGK